MNLKKNAILAVAASAMLLASATSGAPDATAAAAKPVSIVLDGYPLPFPAAPYVANGTTMVPFRAIAEALGIQVDWANRTLTATKSQNGAVRKVVLHQNDKKALVNGQAQQLRVAPAAKDGSIFVPLSFFSQQFGATVGWDGPSQTVSITSPVSKLYTEAFYAISSYKEVGFVRKFDSVSFGWTRIDATGKLTLSGQDFFWPKPAGDVTPESIVQDAAVAGGKPMLMAVAMDGSGELTKLLSDKTLQADVIGQLVGLAAQNGFGGITLDFEGLGLSGDLPATRQSFTDFVAALNKSAKASNLTLALALHPLNSSYRGYDYNALAAHADEIIMMAYEYSYEDGPEPLNRIDEAIRLALADVPKSKLVLGISMGSETAATVNGKIGLAKRYGLKGVAFWRLGLMGDQTLAAIQKSVFLR
ncbi:Glycosyl hydrolases family 18 [Paenibacillus sp. UNC496MF]|uniref:stalk domain-containing protein n=1 Tax=Paenibacillus sp. UNC496MF TaxID=1502753 RepID=UPI0008E281E9|nr:stalk domain-containing protein [Paenibacillus sp. UNC496MF]SFI37463.1 Glycosyl hydrolases family 18 [Paenibacillus sp. UNC496MF]